MAALPETKKVGSHCNANRPDFDQAPDKENEITATMPHSVASVKRDPWLTLGLLRDDLKIIVAHLAYDLSPEARTAALRQAQRALHRVGNGELSAEAWR